MMTFRLFFIERYRWPIYIAGAFLFAAALFTYEQSVLLPIALLGVAFLEKQKVKRKGMIVYASVLSGVDVVYVIVRKLITTEVVGDYEGSNLLAFNWSTLLANAFRILSRLVLNPANKNVFICAVVILLAAVGSLIFLFRRMALNTVAIAFFGGSILLLIAPVISLGLAVNSFESGRYLYLPSIFFVAGISIAAVSVFYHSKNLRRPVSVILILVTGYWLLGKYTASHHYFEASTYAQNTEQKIQQHFKATSDTLYIDTLNVTINRLPVFRLGFKRGINWLNHNIDTNKIIVRNYIEETK
ncbi:hypothetical protein SAE01_18780 [Segetibacter aerophilus]|uniref:Glycosyltransferase RgtA/B/C/D-like domain-containing protein n=2 Tax=Segetibacter aerophilus TaxID=670293 RepID=A0A512BBS1_9BACT|nr:hypothetical protein SAE01_18780 [Segetibacter aerophilus]